jgi:YkoY family integral membrane protein
MLTALFGTSLQVGLFIILNLILIESLLSIDNAAVLATMVGKLKGSDKQHALKYGILGALIMRGACMFFASWLINIWILKIIGGLYLCYLCYSHFTAANDSLEEGVDPEKSKIVLFAEKYLKLNVFWSTVILVEIMDMAFSIDNIFAAVAFTKYIGLIYIGVFIGIFAMRYVAGIFVKLMEKFPFLENVAYIVIGLLGIKLGLSLSEHIFTGNAIATLVSNPHFDLFFSLLTLIVFIVPVIWYLLFHKKTTQVSIIDTPGVVIKFKDDVGPILTEIPNDHPPAA